MPISFAVNLLIAEANKVARRSILVALVILIIICIVGLAMLLRFTVMENETDVVPGSVVELQNVALFWFDKVSVIEEMPDTVEKVEAQIYFETDCASKVQVNSTNEASRDLPFKTPAAIIKLNGVYLLAGSHITFETFVDPRSDFSYPTKICQFSDLASFNALLGATQSILDIKKAEKRGNCKVIRGSSHNVTKTTIDYSIHSHGYFYYAVSVYVEPQSRNTNNVTLSYSYTLNKTFYTVEDLTPHNCSVIDDGCTISGLTKVKRNKLCVLAYVPIPPSDVITTYKFTTTLSHPYGIFTTVLIGLICISVASLIIILRFIVFKKRQNS